MYRFPLGFRSGMYFKLPVWISLLSRHISMLDSGVRFSLLSVYCFFTNHLIPQMKQDFKLVESSLLEECTFKPSTSVFSSVKWAQEYFYHGHHHGRIKWRQEDQEIKASEFWLNLNVATE